MPRCSTAVIGGPSDHAVALPGAVSLAIAETFLLRACCGPPQPGQAPSDGTDGRCQPEAPKLTLRRTGRYSAVSAKENLPGGQSGTRTARGAATGLHRQSPGRHRANVTHVTNPGPRSAPNLGHERKRGCRDAGYGDVLGHGPRGSTGVGWPPVRMSSRRIAVIGSGVAGADSRVCAGTDRRRNAVRSGPSSGYAACAGFPAAPRSGMTGIRRTSSMPS